MRFNTQYDFTPVKQERFDDTQIVETAGYVPRQKTIENLIACGQRLIESRMEEYDGSTVEEALENASVCRVADFDLAESVSYLDRLSDEAERNSARAKAGDSMQVKNKTSELENSNSEVPKE